MVLEQSDSSDSGYVRMQTFNRIFKCDSAESQHGDARSVREGERLLGGGHPTVLPGPTSLEVRQREDAERRVAEAGRCEHKDGRAHLEPLEAR